MSEQHSEAPLSIGEVAAEPADESVEHEREIVGDFPETRPVDTGELTPEDQAQ